MPFHLLPLYRISLLPLSSPCCRSVAMPRTRLSSSRAPMPKSELDPAADFRNGVAESEIRAYVRRKKAKRIAEISEDSKGEVSVQNFRLPDIEEFAYNEAKPSTLARNGPAAKVKLSFASPADTGNGNDLSISTTAGPPANWEEVLEGIRKMRSSDDAPVDSMGCEKAGCFLPPKVEAPSLLEDFELVPVARPPADPALTEQSQILRAQLISLLERPVDQLHQDDLAPVSQLLAGLFPQGITAHLLGTSIETAISSMLQTRTNYAFSAQAIVEVSGRRVAYESAVTSLSDLKTRYTTLHQDLQSRKIAHTSRLAEIAILEARIASLRQEAAAHADIMGDLQRQIDAIPEQLRHVRAEIATHQDPLSTSDALTTFHTRRMDKFSREWPTQLEELKALLNSL